MFLSISTFTSNIPALLSYKFLGNSGFFTTTFCIGISNKASSNAFRISSFPSFEKTLLKTISDVNGNFLLGVLLIVIPPLLYLINISFTISNQYTFTIYAIIFLSLVTAFLPSSNVRFFFDFS